MGFQTSKACINLTFQDNFIPFLLQAENIPAKSKELYERCTGVIQRATDYTKQQIFPFVQALASLRDLYERSAQVSEMKGLVEQAEAERERVMRAVGPGQNILYSYETCTIDH